jgi:hypothetical protein
MEEVKVHPRDVGKEDISRTKEVMGVNGVSNRIADQPRGNK